MQDSNNRQREQELRAQDSLVYLLLNCSRRMKQQLRQQMQGVEQKGQSLDLFAQIDFQGTSISELARRLNCSKQLASRAVNEAVEQGYLRLETCAQDRRKKMVFFSPQGIEALSQGFDLYHVMEAELREKMGTETVDELKQQLKSLKIAMQSSDI